MDTNLTNDQVSELATFIIEDHGLGLTYDAFAEAFLMLCEDIAGWDLSKPQQQDKTLNVAFTIYQASNEENKNGS